jgi:hypothetical protein
MPIVATYSQLALHAPTPTPLFPDVGTWCITQRIDIVDDCA